MTLFDRMASFVDRFREKGVSVALSPNISKTFNQTKTEIMDFMADVEPDYPLDMIPILSKLALINPDFNQSLKRTIFLMNTGFDWELEGASQTVIDAARREIDDWFDTHPGITNKLIRQTAITGVISAEAVPSLELDSIETVQLIPVSKVRFRKEKLKEKTVWCVIVLPRIKFWKTDRRCR